jgi:metal-responsive CopG/Arc/MetJ family transcriptional regulator
MPKVETWLKREVISAVEHMAEENQISRSNWIRDAVLEKLEREGRAVEYRNNKVLPKEGK